MQNGRLASLMARKAQLESRLSDETDHLKRSQIKREKLLLKDEIERHSA
jgi:hypothetical protein